MLFILIHTTGTLETQSKSSCQSTISELQSVTQNYLIDWSTDKAVVKDSNLLSLLRLMVIMLLISLRAVVEHTAISRHKVRHSIADSNHTNQIGKPAMPITKTHVPKNIFNFTGEKYNTTCLAIIPPIIAPAPAKITICQYTALEISK